MSKDHNANNNEHIWPRNYPTWASDHGVNELDLQKRRSEETDHHHNYHQKTKSSTSNEDNSPHSFRYRYHGHESQQGERKNDEVISYLSSPPDFTAYPSWPTELRTMAKCGCCSGESTLICLPRTTSGHSGHSSSCPPPNATASSGHGREETVIPPRTMSPDTTKNNNYYNFPPKAAETFCSAYFNYQNNLENSIQNNNAAACQEETCTAASSFRFPYNHNNKNLTIQPIKNQLNLPLSNNENFNNNKTQGTNPLEEESEQEKANVFMPWRVPLTLVQTDQKYLQKYRHQIIMSRGRNNHHRRVKIRNGKSHPVFSEKLQQSSSSIFPTNQLSTCSSSPDVNDDSDDGKSPLKSETWQVAVGQVVVERNFYDDAGQNDHHDDGYDTEPDYPPERFNYFDSEVIRRESVEENFFLNINNDNSLSSEFKENQQSREDVVDDNNDGENYYPTISEENDDDADDDDDTSRIQSEPCVNKYVLINEHYHDHCHLDSPSLDSIPWTENHGEKWPHHDDHCTSHGGDVVDDQLLTFVNNNNGGDLVKDTDSQFAKEGKREEENGSMMNHHHNNHQDFMVIPVWLMCPRFCGPDEILKKIIIKECGDSSSGGHKVIVYKELRKKPSPIVMNNGGLIYCPFSRTSIPQKSCRNTAILICPSSSIQPDNGVGGGGVCGSKCSKSFLRPRNPPPSCAPHNNNNKCSRDTQVIYYTPKKCRPPSSSSAAANHCYSPTSRRTSRQQNDNEYPHYQPQPQEEDFIRSTYRHQGQPPMTMRPTRRQQHQCCGPIVAGDDSEICIFKCTPSTEKTGCQSCEDDRSCFCCCCCCCSCCQSPSYPCLYTAPAVTCRSKNCLMKKFSNRPTPKPIKIHSPSPSPHSPPPSSSTKYKPPSSPRPRPKLSTITPSPLRRPSKVSFKPPRMYKPKLSKVNSPGGRIPWLSVPFFPILKSVPMPPFVPLQPIPFLELPKRAFSEPRFSTPILFKPSLPQVVVVRQPEIPKFGKIVPPSPPPTPPPTTRGDVIGDLPFKVESMKVVLPPSKISVPPSSKISVPPSSKISVPPSSKISVPPSSKISVPPSSKISVPPSSKNAVPPPAKVSFPKMEPSPSPPKNVVDHPLPPRPKISLPKINLPSKITKFGPPLPQFIPSSPDLPTKRMSNPTPTPPAPPSSPPHVIRDPVPVRRPTIMKIVQVPSPPELMKVIEPHPQDWARPQSPIPNFSKPLQPRSIPPPPQMVIRTPSKPHFTDNLTSTPSSSEDGSGSCSSSSSSSSSSTDCPPPPRCRQKPHQPLQQQQQKEKECPCPCCRPPPPPPPVLPCPQKCRSRRKFTSTSRNAWCSSIKIVKPCCPSSSSSRGGGGADNYNHSVCHPGLSRRRICCRKRKKCRQQQASQYCIDTDMTAQLFSNNNNNNSNNNSISPSSLLYQAAAVAPPASAADSISLQQQLINRCLPLLGQLGGQGGGGCSPVGFCLGNQMLSTAAAATTAGQQQQQQCQYSGSLRLGQMSSMFQNPNNYSLAAAVTNVTSAGLAAAQAQGQGQIGFYGGQGQQPAGILQAQQIPYPYNPYFCGTPCSNTCEGNRSPASAIKNWPAGYQLVYLAPAPASRKLKFNVVSPTPAAFTGNLNNIGMNRLYSSKRAVTGRKC